MVSTYCAGETLFNFVSSDYAGELWDQIFDIPPLDARSFTPEFSSTGEVFIGTTDSAAKIVRVDAAFDIESPPLDDFDFDFTNSEMAGVKTMFPSVERRIRWAESASCPLSDGQHQNAELQDLVDDPLCNSGTGNAEIGECIRVPCCAPTTTPSTCPSKRKRGSASSDSKISPVKTSSPSGAKVKKQPGGRGTLLHGSRGSRGSKAAHSMVERRYRENLNSKMTQLQQTLLMTDYFPKDDLQLSARGSARNAEKPRKGDVLGSTIGYIQQTEIDKRHMSQEIKLLRSQIAAIKRVNQGEDWSLVAQLRVL